MSDWLYPLSSTAGTRFVDPASGDEVGVSFETFRDLVLPSRIEDNVWYLTQNFNNVEVGDRVWVYTGNRDIGVIGLAKIVGVDRRGRHDSNITLQFNKKASKRLCVTPYSAVKVRKYIPYPRGAVQNMDRHPALVRAVEKAAGL